MADSYSWKKKPYFRAAITGAISLAAYVLLFTNQESVTEISTRGGVYAALPVLAAFFFSFVHGTFASDMLSLLGIEAKRRK